MHLFLLQYLLLYLLVLVEVVHLPQDLILLQTTEVIIVNVEAERTQGQFELSLEACKYFLIQWWYYKQV